MAKNGNGKSGGTKLHGPLYTPPGEGSLGAHKVDGPRGGKSCPDPLGLTHGITGTGPGADYGKGQSHDKS